MARERKSGRIVASAVLVVGPDRKMAAMRAASRSGKVSLLGGHVEPGEDPSAAAIREGGEESGGSIRIARVRLLGVWPADDPKYREAGFRVAGYLATRWEADPVLRGSAEGPALWATRSELLSLAEGAFPEWTELLFAAYDGWLRLPPPPPAPVPLQ